VSDRKAYEELVESRLKAWEADIKRLEADIQRAHAESLLTKDGAAAKAREKLESLKATYSELKKANQNAWSELKTGIDNAMTDIKESLDSVKNAYRKDD